MEKVARTVYENVINKKNIFNVVNFIKLNKKRDFITKYINVVKH